MEERTYPIETPDDRSLLIHEGGVRDGPTVFYLHGTPMSGRLYGPHVEDATQRGLRLISYDRPGYGGSTAQPGRSVGDAARDVATVADHLGVERFGVWGISGGGPHALACAALLGPRVVAAVALASPAPYPAEGLDWLGSTGESNIEEFHAALRGPEPLATFLTPLRAMYFRSDRRAVDQELESLLTPTDRQAYSGALRDFLLSSAREALAPGLAGWRDDDLAFVRPWGFDLRSIRLPVTVWQGREDLFVPFAHGKWLAERVPHAVGKLSEEDGHLTLYQRRIPEVHAWLASRLRP